QTTSGSFGGRPTRGMPWPRVPYVCRRGRRDRYLCRYLYPARDRAIKKLNQGQGGIYMGKRLKDRVGRRGVAIGFGLQDRLAAACDFVSPIGQATKERAHFLADLGRGSEAGVGGHFRADPAPHMLVRVEVGAIGR